MGRGLGGRSRVKGPGLYPFCVVRLRVVLVFSPVSQTD